MPPARPVTRREWLTLGAFLGIAAGGAMVGKRLRPVGTILPESPVYARAIATQGPEAGARQGSLLMLVFTDFNCPICKSTHPAMLDAAGRDGDVTLRFLDWPIFGADSNAAAEGALAAAEQGLYFPVHDRLMRGGHADGRAAGEALRAAGGDIERWQAVRRRDRPRIETMLRANAFAAFSLGLQGTPGYLAGRVLLQGGASEGEFRRAFARARKLF